MKYKRTTSPTYSLLEEISASKTKPLPQFWINSQLSSMREGLAQLETGEHPDKEDWRVCADAVNFLETLIEMGEVEDTQGLLNDAVTAMGECGARVLSGKSMRLTGQGIQTVRAVLQDYSEVIQVLPARTMIHAHRMTERRNTEIRSGRGRPHDVVVVLL